MSFFSCLAVGEGTFGLVRQARAEGIVEGTPERNIVAVKSTRGKARSVGWCITDRNTKLMTELSSVCSQSSSTRDQQLLGGTSVDEENDTTWKHCQFTGSLHHSR